MFKLIGASITHRTWGHGVIEAADNELITADFGLAGHRKLAVPRAFEAGLVWFDNPAQQAAYLNALPGRNAGGQTVAETGGAAREATLRADVTPTVPRPRNTKPGEVPDRPTVGAALVVGEVYPNATITATFQVSSQAGMRRSKKTNSLVLIAKHDGEPERNPYQDGWDEEGRFLYTGMGRIGDQSLTYAQNRTLAESATNGVRVYLFESLTRGQYTYRGRVVLAGEPFAVQEHDAEGRPRRVYRFPLRVVD
ncbi:hypothetical protein [Lacticaseibacillus suihuaensis]